MSRLISLKNKQEIRMLSTMNFVWVNYLPKCGHCLEAPQRSISNERSISNVFTFKWKVKTCLTKFLFVCVEVLRTSQPNGVMSSAVSFTNHNYWAGLVL